MRGKKPNPLDLQGSNPGVEAELKGVLA